MYATQLGDDQPNPGGYWLKTLYAMSKARIWWATTDAHEEYEDELLTQLAGLFAIDDATRARTLGLPFGNLVTSDGRAKAHGLENPLRDAATAAAPLSSRAGPSRVRTQRAVRPSEGRSQSPRTSRPRPSRPWSRRRARMTCGLNWTICAT